MANHEDDFFERIARYLRDEAYTPAPDPIKEETKRKRAVAIAQRQAELVRKMHELDAQDDKRVTSGYSLYSEVIDQSATRKLSLGLFNYQISPWFGIDHIGLHTFDQNPHQESRNGVTNNPLVYFPQYFDIDTLTFLWVGTSTDPIIKQQVSQMLSKGQLILSQVYQIYIIGEGGRHGHISGFPRTILDNRPDIGHQEMTNKHVVAPMTDEDFSGAEISLGLLEAAVQR